MLFSLFQVEIRNEHDFATYVCVAKNDIGEEDVRFTLDRGEKPIPVEGPKNVLVHSDYVELELYLTNQSDVTPGMEADGFYVEYRVSNESSEWNRTEFDLTEGNVITGDSCRWAAMSLH